MIASKPIGRFSILCFEIAVFVIIGALAADALAADVTLAWDPNTESDLAGYRIHHGTASGSYSVHIDVNKVTTYTLTGLTAGQTYYFAATAYDASGNESGYSNSVSYAVPGAAVNGAPTTPATPSGAAGALVNTAVTFSTSATDPNGDSLQYQYDWGGGVLSSWGASSQSRSWAAAGQYAVKAKARD
ncbi:MAG: fibronectin type III domain-containing protein, partial [Desulfobacterales bacterium]|nr:fibronectin type III domain-containing protein [Desulfobacterales bacterium]